MFNGHLGDEEWLDTNGILERTGIGIVFGLFSGAASIIVLGALGFHKEDDWNPSMITLCLGALVPLCILAIAWVQLGVPRDIARFRAEKLPVDPRYVGIGATPALFILWKIIW